MVIKYFKLMNKKKNINFYLIILLSSFISCNPSNKNDEKIMEDAKLSSKLSKINLMETNKLDSLAKEIVLDSQKDVNELVKILHSGNDDEAKKASLVMMSIGDLAITPMLDSLDTQNADNYAWEMDIISTQYLKNRNKITLVLNSMLLDKRQLKNPELIGTVEEKPIPKRVCDEAYLMLRKLTSFKETEEDLMINERRFLDMTDEERDKEISRIKSSKEWISLLEHLSE